jgi:competence protein ComEA
MDHISRILDTPAKKYGVVIIFAVVLVLAFLYDYQEKRGEKVNGEGELLIVSNTTLASSKSLEGQEESKNNNYLYIDMSGALKTPGVYKVDKNSILASVIASAGGISEEASRVWVSRYLDLSKELTKNQKVYIPFAWEIENFLDEQSFANYLSDQAALIETEDILTPKELSDRLTTESNIDINFDTDSNADKNKENNNYSDDLSNDTTASVNINTANNVELESLSGIGPKYAQKLIDNRPYKDFNEVVEKSSVPKSTLEKIEEYFLY